MTQNKNILLNQLFGDKKIDSIQELIPPFSNDLEDIKYLTFGSDINWSSISGSSSLIVTQDASGDLTLDTSIDAFQGTEMYFSDGQIGIGRLPLHEYKVDVAVPVNTRMTAMHIGDGVFGFSLGNATDAGFLPQIIGIGSDSDDAGLYFLGKVSSSEGSHIPALVFDARDMANDALENRPIMGISSGSYTNYKFLIDASGRVGIGITPLDHLLEVNGDIRAINIIINSSTGTQDLREELESIKQRLYDLENIDSSI